MTQRLALISDTSAYCHWGCTATSLGLRAVASNAGPVREIVSLDRLANLVHVPENAAEFHSDAFASRHLAANGDVYRRLRSCDTIVVNGEGSLHGGSFVARALLYAIHLAQTVLDKTVFVVNHSVVPRGEVPGEEWISEIYHEVYARLKYVAVRDPQSLNELADIGIVAVQAADCLPMYMTAAGLDKKRQREQAILVTGSSLCDENYMAAVDAVVATTIAKGLKVKAIMGAKRRFAFSEAQFITSLRRRWPEVSIGSCESLAGFADTIGSVGMLVTGRYHYSLAAFALGTPTIMLDANTHKNSATSTMLGMPPPLVVDSDLSVRVIQAMEAVWANSRQAVPSTTALDSYRRMALRNSPVPADWQQVVNIINSQRTDLTRRTLFDRVSDRSATLRFNVAEPEQSLRQVLRRVGFGR